MSLNIIMGPRSSGKTKCLYDEILSARKNHTESIYLIVPEQVSFNHEYEFDKYRGSIPMPDFQIKSFTRLAYDVLSQYGGLANGTIDKLGYKFVLQKVILDVQDKLMAYGSVYDTDGFYDEVMSMIGEIDSNMLLVDDLYNIADLLDNGDNFGYLSTKLRDLALIKETLNQYKGEDFLDNTGITDLFIKAITDSDLLKGAIIFIDDFYDFTNHEYLIIDKLLSVVSDMAIILLMDKASLDKAYVGPYNKSKIAYDKLQNIAKENNCLVIDKWLYCSENTDISVEIKHLQDNYFDYPTVKYNSSPSDIILIEGKDICSEIHGVARHIVGLLRDGVCSIKDINIVLRDVGVYGPILKEIMQQYSLPVYIDEKIDLKNHPLFVYLAAFINVYENKFRYDDVINMIKSPFFPMSIEDSDIYENYSLAHGIKGKKFYQEEDFEYNDEEVSNQDINRIRKIFREFMLPYNDLLKGKKSPADYCRMVYDFMVASNVPAILEQFSEEQMSLGDTVNATVFGGIWDRFVYLLDQMVLGLEDEPITISEFNKIISMAVKEVDLGLIPKGLGVIPVSVLGHSRVPVKKVSFVVGVNEGMLPSSPNEDSLMSMRERDTLIRAGVLWEKGSNYHWDNEKLLIHMALTSATDKLYFSYNCGVSGEEKSSPSIVIKRIEQLFPDIEFEYPIAFPVLPEDVSTDMASSRENLFKLMPYIYKYNKSLYKELYAYYKNLPEYAHRMDKLLAGNKHINVVRPISQPIIDAIWSKQLALSISKLETYNKCPFSYFMRYGLRLKERKEYIFQSLDVGNFFHYALESLMTRMKELNIAWTQLAEYKDELIAWVVKETSPKISGEILFSDEKMEFVGERLAETLEVAINIMIEQANAGDQFVPVRWEVDFGPDGQLSSQSFSIKIDDERELVLVGKIDRVDGAETENSFYYRVIDYKSSKMDLNLSEVYYGHKLQLLVYLAIVKENANQLFGDKSSPAGAFYFAVRDFFVSVDSPATPSETIGLMLKEGKLNGYTVFDDNIKEVFGESVKKSALTDDNLAGLESHIDKIIKDCGQKILMGDYAIEPSFHDKKSSCKYCEMSAICGFDPLIPGNKERYLPKLKDDMILGKLGGDKNGSN